MSLIETTLNIIQGDSYTIAFKVFNEDKTPHILESGEDLVFEVKDSPFIPSSIITLKYSKNNITYNGTTGEYEFDLSLSCKDNKHWHLKYYDAAGKITTIGCGVVYIVAC